MDIKSNYKPRPIRFLELYKYENWQVKIYSISKYNEFVEPKTVELAKTHFGTWLFNSKNYSLDIYNIATVILHEGKEGCFALINWWIDENMIQNHVYLLNDENGNDFKAYSDKGIMACVWELEVIWFERNNWIRHVLSKAPHPDYDSYLKQHLNKD